MHQLVSQQQKLANPLLIESQNNARKITGSSTLMKFDRWLL
jgi:hypothetical protein